MKLHVVKQGDTSIEGYKKIEFLNGNFLGLDDVSNNSSEEIFANDVLDAIPNEFIQQSVAALVGKLRVNGRITVGGTELRLFVKSVLNQGIPEDQAMSIIKTNQSMLNFNKLCELMKSMGLEVETTTINGIHCEVKCVRK
jgi:hypothetical protein